MCFFLKRTFKEKQTGQVLKYRDLGLIPGTGFRSTIPIALRPADDLDAISVGKLGQGYQEESQPTHLAQQCTLPRHIFSENGYIYLYAKLLHPVILVVFIDD